MLDNRKLTCSIKNRVPGPDCGILAGCPHIIPKYDEGGEALGTNTSIQYGSGSTEGANYIDDVTVAGLTSPNQTLFSVTTAYGFSQIDADGICGMAFTSVRASDTFTLSRLFFSPLPCQFLQKEKGKEKEKAEAEIRRQRLTCANRSPKTTELLSSRTSSMTAPSRPPNLASTWAVSPPARRTTPR